MINAPKEHDCPEKPSKLGQFSTSRNLEVKETTPRISVVILAYRSGKGIYKFVKSIVRSLEENEPNWEIILVGNHFSGDGDPTPCIVSEIACLCILCLHFGTPKFVAATLIVIFPVLIAAIALSIEDGLQFLREPGFWGTLGIAI